MSDYKAYLGIVPSHMAGVVERYVDHGIPPGSFLTALLENNLSEAIGRADDENRRAITTWATFVHSYLPSGCHGSHERVNAWIKQGGLEGLKQNAE